MNKNNEPENRPHNPNFSCGPCSKRPGWTPDVLKSALTGRSHRAPDAKARLKLAIDKTQELLQVPAGYRVAIVPGSDTGAFEMALWNMLGPRGVDVLAWENFGRTWVRDIVEELHPNGARAFEADYGHLPDLAKVDFDRDVVFTWNGTAAGVRVPDGAWIPADRAGLTFVDATSALFAQEIDWAKADVTTFSWQKVLGGEAAHGMLILSPRAIERLESHVPGWPIPKLFRLTEGGHFSEEICDGETINTPSMLCVEDYLDTLSWVESIGGLAATRARADANAAVLYDWIDRTDWVANLAVDPATRSNTSVCLKFVEPAVVAGGRELAAKISQRIVGLLSQKGVANDISAYRTAPPGLRIWCGSTVEAGDLAALTPWLDWAYAEARAAFT